MVRQHIVCSRLWLPASAIVVLLRLLSSATADPEPSPQKPMVRRAVRRVALQSHSPHQVAEELSEQLADLATQVRRLGQKVAKFENSVDETSSTMQVHAGKTAVDVEATGKAVHVQAQPDIASADSADEPFPIGPPTTVSEKVASKEWRPTAASEVLPLSTGDGASDAPVDLSESSRAEKVASDELRPTAASKVASTDWRSTAASEVMPASTVHHASDRTVDLSERLQPRKANYRGGNSQHRAEEPAVDASAKAVDEARHQRKQRRHSSAEEPAEDVNERAVEKIERIQKEQAARIAAAKASGTVDAAGIQEGRTKPSVASSNHVDDADANNPFPNTIAITMPEDDAATSTLNACPAGDAIITGAACNCGGADCPVDDYCLADDPSDAASALNCHTHPRDTDCPTGNNAAEDNGNQQGGELAYTCRCDPSHTTNECQAGKFCYNTGGGRTCHDHYEGYDCTASLTHPLATRCQCDQSQNDNECLVGQFCYDEDGDGANDCVTEAEDCGQFIQDSCPYYCAWVANGAGGMHCAHCNGVTVNCTHEDCRDQTTQADCLAHPCRWDATNNECEEQWTVTLGSNSGTNGNNDWWARLMADRQAAIAALRAAIAAENAGINDLNR